MAQSITLGPTPVPLGVTAFAIDSLPAGTDGFILVVGRNASWLVAGKLFDLLLEIALDGVNFQTWMKCTMNGGAAFDIQGNAVTTWRLSGKWPGENDGAGGRRVLYATDVRITLTTAQAFSITSLNLTAV
jgi:hypothetical protein